MTREEFEQAYAQRSGATVEHLRELGLSAYPCGPEQGCDYEKCEGWQMLTPQMAADAEQLRNFQARKPYAPPTLRELEPLPELEALFKDVTR